MALDFEQVMAVWKISKLQENNNNNILLPFDIVAPSIEVKFLIRLIAVTIPQSSDFRLLKTCEFFFLYFFQSQFDVLWILIVDMRCKMCE